MKLSHVSALVATLLLAHTGAFADQLQDVKSKGEIVCGTFSSIEPFGFPDPRTREIVGFDVDLCSAIAKEIGVKVSHRGLAVEARVPELTLGHVNIVVANLAYSESRAKQIDFSDSYYLHADMVIVPKRSNITQLSELDGKRLSTPKGSTAEPSIRKKLPKATVMTFQDAPAAFLALAQGKVEGASFNPLLSGSFVRRSQSTPNPMVMLKEPLSIAPSAVGVKKGETALLDAVNKALAALESSGELSRIWNKWIGPETAYGLTRDFKVTPISQIKFDPLP